MPDRPSADAQGADGPGASKAADAFRTISEVAEALGVPAHVLRFWESKFSQVKPVKRAGGRRYYRPADIALIDGIRKLLHDDGLTIRGVQKLLQKDVIRRVAALSQFAAVVEPAKPGASMPPSLPIPRAKPAVVDPSAVGGPDQSDATAASSAAEPEPAAAAAKRRVIRRTSARGDDYPELPFDQPASGSPLAASDDLDDGIDLDSDMVLPDLKSAMTALWLPGALRQLTPEQTRPHAKAFASVYARLSALHARLVEGAGVDDD